MTTHPSESKAERTRRDLRDGNWAHTEADWKEDRLYKLIRKHQPEALIINNTGLDARGVKGHPELDSTTFEQGLPTRPDRRGWPKYLAGEMCQTMNAHWGVGARDFNYLSPAQVTKSAFILGLISVLVVSFHFFNMVLVNAYNWLIRDVVPLEVMSRFLAWFSIVGTISSALFLWFVFPHLMTHRKEIFLVVGVFYLLAFFLMCWKVKEGAYPPPTPVEDRPGVFKTFVVYFRECLQIPLYRNFFLVYLLVTAALNCAGNFITLFARESLGLDMGGMGHIFAYTAAISIIFFYPLGWLCDRFSPMHVALGSICVLCLGAILAPIFVHSQNGFLIYSLAFSLPCVAWQLSQRATSMKLFPAEKFGQFSSGLNVFGCGALIVGNILIGALMDAVHSNYRMAFLWTAVIAASAIFPMILVIRGWKRHGGHDDYVPPLPN